MITRVRSWCVGGLSSTCIEGVIVHAYFHVFINEPFLDRSHFENGRKLSMGLVMCFVSEFETMRFELVT